MSCEKETVCGGGGSYRQSSHHNGKIKERRCGKGRGEEDAEGRVKIYGEGKRKQKKRGEKQGIFAEKKIKQR